MQLDDVLTFAEVAVATNFTIAVGCGINRENPVDGGLPVCGEIVGAVFGITDDAFEFNQLVGVIQTIDGGADDAGLWGLCFNDLHTNRRRPTCIVGVSNRHFYLFHIG